MDNKTDLFLKNLTIEDGDNQDDLTTIIFALLYGFMLNSIKNITISELYINIHSLYCTLNLFPLPSLREIADWQKKALSNQLLVKNDKVLQLTDKGYFLGKQNLDKFLVLMQNIN